MDKYKVLVAVVLAAMSFPALVSSRKLCDDIRNCTPCTENETCGCESFSNWYWVDLPCIKKNGDAHGFLWNYNGQGKRFKCENYGDSTAKPECKINGKCTITSTVWFGELINGLSECYEAKKVNHSLKEVVCTNVDNISSSILTDQYSLVAIKIDNVSTDLEDIKSIMGKVKLASLFQNLINDVGNNVATFFGTQIANLLRNTIEGTLKIIPTEELIKLLHNLTIELPKERESRSKKCGNTVLANNFASNCCPAVKIIEKTTNELNRSNSDIKELLQKCVMEKPNFEPYYQNHTDQILGANEKIQNLLIYLLWGIAGVGIMLFMIIVLLVIFLVKSSIKSSKNADPDVNFPMEKIIRSADKVSLNSEMVVENDCYGVIGNYS